MIRSRALLTGMMSLALTAFGASALPAFGQIAVTDPGDMSLRNNGHGNWSGNTGFEFTVGKQDLSVSSLGIYDAPGNVETPNQGKAGDGLETEAVVAIYETKGRTEVGEVIVPAGEKGELKDDYRYSKLDKPVTLHADTTYRIVIGVNKGGNGFLDYKGSNDAKAPAFSDDITVTMPVFATRGNAKKAAYPGDNRRGNNRFAFSGPNFQYEGTGKATAAPKVDPLAQLRSGKPGPDNKPDPTEFPGKIVTTANFETGGVEPDGWKVQPPNRNPQALNIVDLGAGGSLHALKAVNDSHLHRISAEGSLTYTFPKPVDRVAIEFDVKWTTEQQWRPNFSLFTEGPDHNTASQVKMGISGNVLTQYRGILPGIIRMRFNGETPNARGLTSHWYRVRVVASKDSNGVSVWISEPDQTVLPKEPTQTVAAYGLNQPIASVHFGLVDLSPNTYYLDNITLRTGDDIPNPKSVDSDQQKLKEGYQLWTGKTFPRTFEEIAYPDGLEYHIINTRKSPWSWQHGVSIAWHKGALYASWGANKGSENTPGEVVLGAKSTDDGKTWSDSFIIAPGDGQGGKEYSNSHGVFFNHKGTLWGFFQHWKGGWDNPLAVEAFVLNDQTGKWESKGIVGRKGWPIDPPQPLENGNWIIGLSGFKMYEPAVMISHGEDLLHWDTVQIPTEGKGRFPETSLITHGNNVLSITRRGRTALVGTSKDGGKTWTEAKPSNYPNDANTSSGVLSTGQWFIVSNMRDRDDLEIGVGKPGEKGISKLYKVRYGAPPDAAHAYKGNTFPRAYAYPSTTEHDGKLYVVYSVNKADIELAVIPIASLKAE